MMGPNMIYTGANGSSGFTIISNKIQMVKKIKPTNYSVEWKLIRKAQTTLLLSLLNKKSELINKYRHENEYVLCQLVPN